MDGGLIEKKPKPSRTERQRRRLRAMHDEVTNLQALAETLIGHLEAAIRPGLTDADRIRYRCMIQDIRKELKGQTA